MPSVCSSSEQRRKKGGISEILDKYSSGLKSPKGSGRSGFQPNHYCTALPARTASSIRGFFVPLAGPGLRLHPRTPEGPFDWITESLINFVTGLSFRAGCSNLTILKNLKLGSLQTAAFCNFGALGLILSRGSVVLVHDFKFYLFSTFQVVGSDGGTHQGISVAATRIQYGFSCFRICGQ